MEDKQLQTPQPKDTLQKAIIQDSVDFNPIDTSQSYVPIESIFPDSGWGTNSQEEFDSKMRFDLHKPMIDKLAPGTLANMYVPQANLATDTFNPNQQPLSAIDEMQKVMETPVDTSGVYLPEPMFGNIRNLNFDRAYESNKFMDIGFSPVANMDAIYNTNQSNWDGFSRGFEQFLKLAGTGFVSSYRSIGDLFDGDGYFTTPDLTSAKEMEDAMRIGGSTTGSAAGWFGNLGLNFGYTAGIVASIAVEEVVLAAVSAAGTMPTGGASWGLFAAGTLNNLRKLGSLQGVFKAARSSRELIKNIARLDNARTFYNTTGDLVKGVGRIFTPETVYAIKNWKTTGNTLQNLYNISKNTHAFGAFYRDLRAVNAAMSEAKMEAGMVENRVRTTATDYYNYKSGGKGITAEQSKEIALKSADAAFKAQMANFAVIYASNKIVLRNALGGWQRKIGANTRRILREGPGKYVKNSKWLIKSIPKEIKAAYKIGGMKAAAKVPAYAMLRYGSANLAEGLQEVSQEAISASTAGYYGSLLRDPIAGGPATLGAYSMQAIGDQFSSEGFSAFASGFLMGGLAGPYQQVLFQGIPSVARRVKSKSGGQGFKDEYSKSKEQVIDDVVKFLNERGETMNNELDVVMSPTQFQASLQKSIEAGQNTAIALDDKYDFFNNRNFSEFYNLYQGYKSGAIKYLREDLVEYSKMTDEELSAAFPKKETGRNVEKTRQKIQNQINYIDQYGENIATKADKLFPPKYRPEQHKKGSREYRNEYFKKQAYEHQKMLYIFNNEAFKDAAKRQNEIYVRLETEPLFSKMAASDITTLLNKETIEQEIKILDKEIEAMATVEDKASIKKKKDKRDKLQAFYNVFTNENNLTIKGNFDRRKKAALSRSFKSYVQTLAEQNNDFVDQDLIDEALTLIVDHTSLKEDAIAFNKAIEFMINPEKMDEMMERTTDYFSYLYKNRMELYKAQAENYVGTLEKNALINGIAELNVFIDDIQLRQFLESGDSRVMTKFYTDGRELDPRVKEDLEIIQQIATQITAYDLLTRKDPKVEEVQKAAVEQTQQDLNEKFSEAGYTVSIGDTSNSTILNRVLEDKYRLYRANTYENVLSLADWMQSSEGLKYKEGFDAIKRFWANGTDIIVNEGGQEVVRKKIPTKAEVESEEGLQTFIDSAEARTEPFIKEMLSDLGVSFDDYTSQKAVIKQEKKIINDGEGVVFDVIEKVLPGEQGQNEKVYEIVDKNGNPLTDQMLKLIDNPYGTYSDAGKAKLDRNILDKEFSDGSVFMFDGLRLSKGISVFNRENEEYRVNSNPQMAKNGNIMLVPVDSWTNNYQTRKSNSIVVSEVDFNKNYTTEKVSFDQVPSNATRLTIDEFIKVYPSTNKDEFTKSAKERLDYITSLLTPEDVNELTLVISKNTVEPYDRTYGSEEYLDTIPNKYIRRKQETYTIGIKINNPGTLAGINKSLEDAGLIPLGVENDGVIGYIPNDQFYFVEGVTGKQMPMQMMPLDFFNNVMLTPKDMTSEEAMSIAKNNHAKSIVLFNAVSKLIEDNQTEVSLSELPDGLKILNFEGYPDYPTIGEAQEYTSLESLKQSSDGKGNILIYDISRNKETGAAISEPAVISNLLGDEKTNLEEEVKAGLMQNGLWDKMVGDNSFSYTERYMYAIKQPNGTYTLATSKASRIEPEQVSELFLGIINQAVKTRQENYDTKTQKFKESGYNTKNGYNGKLNDDFRISMKPGYQMGIEIDDYGNIVADFYYFDAKGKSAKIGTKQKLTSTDIAKEGTSLSKLKILLDKLNNQPEAIEAGLSVTVNNFVNSIDLNSPVSEMLKNLETKLRPTIRRNSYLYINASDGAIQAVKDKPVNISRPTPLEPSKEETPADIARTETQRTEALSKLMDDSKVTSEEVNEAFDSQRTGEITDTVFQNFVDDPTTVSAQIIDALTEKIITGQTLTPREQAIRQEKSIAPQIEELLQAKVSSEQKEDIDLTLTAATPLDVVNAKIQTIVDETVAEVGAKNKRKALAANKEYQTLLKQRELLLKPGNKVLPARLNTQDVEDINEFLEWASYTLPEFISIEDITALGNNLKAGGIRVGAFVVNLNRIAGGLDVSGTLYTGASNPFKYHEAFHGVYRLLLTPEEQKTLLAIAKKEKRAELRKAGLSFEKELQKFKNSADTYSEYTREQLEKEYYEEYMADQFELFKTSPKNTKTDSAIKSFFNRILEWIRSVFNSYSKNQLRTLFENIDAGKYKTAEVVANDFTTDYTTSTITANALLPYKAESVNGRTGQIYLDSALANNMVQSMAAMFIERRRKNPTEKKLEILNGVIDDFAWLYDPLNPQNKVLESSLDVADQNKYEKLKQIDQALNYDISEDGTSNIHKSVDAILDIIDTQFQEQEFNADEYENQDGLRNVTQFGKEAYMNGGFSSLSTYLRAYLATISKEQKDIFGNTELVEGEPLIVPVDVFQTYNGLLKAVTGITEPLQILQAMYVFAQSNPNTKAVVDKIFNDIGIVGVEQVSDITLPTNLQDSTLFNQITKGFTNFRAEWLFTERDNSGNVIVYSASQRDDVNNQTNIWSEAYTSKKQTWKVNPKAKQDATKALDNFANYFRIDDKLLSDEFLKDESVKISQEIFETVGIKLSPLYIQYSIASGRTNKTDNQKILARVKYDANPITAKKLYFISEVIKNDGDLFSPNEDGAISRLKELAVNNAMFDETIGLSVFKNSNGDLVNAHQVPTLHLKKAQSLNNISEISKLLEDPYLQSNHLLNNPAFVEMTKLRMHQIIRMAGTKVGNKLVTQDDLDGSLKTVLSTQEYGDYTPSEFLLNFINNYTLGFNTKSNKLKLQVSANKVDPKTGATQETITALSPSLLRVLESSNTGDLMALPVTKTVEFKGGKVQITQETLDVFYNFVKSEYDRIVRESNPDTKTKEDIIGYNAIDKDKPDLPLRAYEFANSAGLLSTELMEQLKVSASLQEPITFEAALKNANTSKTQFINSLNINLNGKFLEFNDLLEELNVKPKISNFITKGLVQDKKGQAYADARNSAEALNLRADLDYNLRQIFFNDYINTKSINEIFLGDQAKTLSNSIDKIKRAKAQNAAFHSVYSPTYDKDLGVNHATENINFIAFDEPLTDSSFTNQSIQEADAQMYMTTKAFRHFWFGLGKLSPAQAAVLDKIENGEKITSTDIFGDNKTNGIVDSNGMLNSKKFVYADGSTFIKMSGFVLSPEFTSIDTGERVTASDGITQVPVWKANPARVKLHNLRMKMESLEQENNSVSIAAPKSASKMLKQNLFTIDEVTEGESIANPSIVLNARSMGLQVVNPSNKAKISEVTQIKAIITSEQNDNEYVDALGLTVGQIKEAYNTAVKRRVTIAYKGKRNLVFTFDGAMNELNISKENNKLTPNLEAFLKYATNSLKAAKSSSNLLEYFSVDPETNEQNYNLNNPYAISKFEQLFLSYFSKGVLQEKIPGHGLALVSDFGSNIYRRVYSVNEDGTPDRSEVVRNREAIKLDVDNRSVQDLVGINIPEGGIIVMDRLRYGLKEYDVDGKPTGQRYSEAMIPAHFKDVMDFVENKDGKIPDAISKMFAVRIPSQDKHSTMNVKLVDFLPSYYGSSAMFSKELVEVSGADFDIDKAYTHIKEWYFDRKTEEFREYGAKEGREYQDYVNYINTKVDEDTIYAEALASFKIQGSQLEDSYTDAELLRLNDLGLSDNSIKALSRLGLPKTKEEYNDYKALYGEPYSAPLNNKILDYRFALAGNESMKDIAVQPASLDAIEAAWEFMQREVPEYTETKSQANLDVDNLYGKAISFRNNKGAAIGRAVSPNLYLSLLSEYGIKLPEEMTFKIEGQQYTGFDTYTDKIDGKRKQDIISSIITMLTDNSKENYVAKLGMNAHAVGVVTNMVALGVPLEHSLLLVNSKLIRDIYEQANNKQTKYDKGVSSLVTDKIKELTKSKKLKISNTPLSQDLLIEGVTGETLTKKDQVDILSVFYKANRISGFTGKMNALTGLSNGLGGNFADVQDRITQLEDLGLRKGKSKTEPLLDIQPIIKNSWVKSNLDIFNLIADDLIPTTFVTGTKGFNDIYDELSISFDTDNAGFDSTVQESIRKDLLSYLTIKAYQKNGFDNESASVGTLSNKLIYQNNNPDFNIFTVVKRLKDAEPNNFFLDNFFTQILVNDESNNTGINLLKANTFRKLNKFQKIDLQTSFAKLYGNVKTRKDALSIVNYLMVKDGLQLAEGTLLEAITPFVIDNYLSQIPAVQNTLQLDKNYEDTFGLSKNDLINEFTEGYLSSNITGAKLIQVVKDLEFTTKNWMLNAENKLIYQEDFENKAPQYVRLNEEVFDQGNAYTKYTLFKLSEEKTKTGKGVVYTEVDSYGSNFQNAIGFMFGPRPTYSQVRETIKNKKGSVLGRSDYNSDEIQKTEPDFDNIDFTSAPTVPTRALQDETLNIDATNDSVDFIDKTKSVNISDDQLSSLLGISPTQQTSEVNQSDNQLSAEANLPEQSAAEQQLQLEFEETIENQYKEITEFWDENVEGMAITDQQKDIRSYLRDNKILSLEDMINLFKSNTNASWESEQDFIDEIKNCS